MDLYCPTSFILVDCTTNLTDDPGNGDFDVPDNGDFDVRLSID